MTDDAGGATQSGAAGPADDAGAEQDLHELVSAAESGTDGSGDALKKAQAEAAKWKTHARTWEGRAKENSTAAEKLAQLEQQQMTEQQRAEARATAAEQRARESELRAWRSDAVRGYSLPADIAQFLSGETEQDITAAAETFARVINERVEEGVQEALKNGQGAGNGTPGGARLRRPVEALRPGAAPAGTPAEVTGDDWLRGQLSGRR